MNLNIKKIIAIILSLCMLSTTATLIVFAADNTVSTDAAVPENAGTDSGMDSMNVTIGEVCAVMAAYMTQYIDPANLKGLENVKIDMENLDSSMVDNLILYAKAAGLTSGDSIEDFKTAFKTTLDLNAPATRQEYAFILEKTINILKIQGINFVVPKPVSSSSSVAKGSGNGAGSSNNISSRSVSGVHANLAIDYYRDYKDLSGYAQKSYSFALSIGALDVKKYSEAKTVKINNVDDLIIVRDGYVLAPNDILTVGELMKGMEAVMGLKLTHYTWHTVINPIPATPVPVPETTAGEPAAVEK